VTRHAPHGSAVRLHFWLHVQAFERPHPLGNSMIGGPKRDVLKQ
jgi:hypothetical protein